MNVKKIEIREGDNKIEDGIVVGKHPFKVVALFDSNQEWVIRMPELEKIIEAISKCEDLKFPTGLGRNMFLLAHLVDLFPYLYKHGFNHPPADKEFSKKFKIGTDVKIEDKTEVKK